MREITTRIYSYEELSPKAKAKAFQDYTPYFDHNVEFEETLEEFCSMVGIEMADYEVDSYSNWFSVASYGKSRMSRCNGLRLAKYLNNNYADLDSMRDGLGLTGIYMDYAILDPLVKAMEYQRVKKTFEEVINECLQNFFDLWQEDIDYIYSEEYFVEDVESNDWEFLEDGTRF